MKYIPRDYAWAFCEELKTTPADKTDRLIKKFVERVYKNSDSLNFEKILTEINKKLIREDGGRIIDLEFAREIANDQIKKMKSSFKTKDLISVRVNPSLVAGVRVTINGEQEFDNSLAGKLKKVFNA